MRVFAAPGGKAATARFARHVLRASIKKGGEIQTVSAVHRTPPRQRQARRESHAFAMPGFRAQTGECVWSVKLAHIESTCKVPSVWAAQRTVSRQIPPPRACAIVVGRKRAATVEDVWQANIKVKSVLWRALIVTLGSIQTSTSHPHTVVHVQQAVPAGREERATAQHVCLANTKRSLGLHSAQIVVWANIQSRQQ